MNNKFNMLAIGVAGFASFVLSFIWYTMLFRQPYLDGLGKTSAQLAQGPSTLEASLLQLAGNLVMAYVLAWLLAHMNATNKVQAIRLGVVLWLGFVAAIIIPMYAFQAFSWTFAAINVGYPLAAIIVMTLIISGWKRK